jgi:hypothetical protein
MLLPFSVQEVGAEMRDPKNGLSKFDIKYQTD